MSQTYKELYPNSLTEGIGLIQNISMLSKIPWNALTTEEKNDLERAYYIRSGDKKIVESFATADFAARANIIAAIFAQKWTKLWNDFTLEYNALDAYTLSEEEKITRNREGTDTLSHGKTVISNETDTGTVDTSSTDTGSEFDNIYGFNSTLAVPSTTGSDSATSTGKEERDLATSSTTTNCGTDTRNTNDDETENRTLKKSGNIGYTTPQEMLRQDIELWATPFFTIVFQDIDSYITILTYD